MFEQIESKMSLKNQIKQLIQTEKVLVFSKSYCPYCDATKSLLRTKGVDFKLFELDQLPNGDEMQKNLAEITGQRTVPNVFINKEHIGGNSDLQALEQKGQLSKKLANL